MMTNVAVRTGSHDAPELAALAEHIERRAWRDLVAAAPQWLRRTTGVAADEVGGAMVLTAPGLNHLLFNRVIGLGEQAAATPELIAEIMGRYWDLSIEHYWVHVGPYARPARLGRMLQEQGFAIDETLAFLAGHAPRLVEAGVARLLASGALVIQEGLALGSQSGEMFQA